MGIKYTHGDLLRTGLTNCVIPHVCNDQGVWGAGFVVPLGKNFPSAKMGYLKWHGQCGGSDYFKRGQIQWVEEGHVCIANMIAQDFRDGRRLRYSDLATCMQEVAETILYAGVEKYKIKCPMFGSGLAGGDWMFIHELIMDIWVDQGIDVEVFYLQVGDPNVVELYRKGKIK